MVRIENNSHMLEITWHVSFLKFLLAFFAFYQIKLFKLGLFATKLGAQHYMVCLAFSRIKWFKLCLFATKVGIQHYWIYVIELKMFESKTTVICLKLHAKLRLWDFCICLKLHGSSNMGCVARNFVHNTIWYMVLCWNCWNWKQ